MSRPRRIAIDLRMLDASGIGTYIRHLLPLILTARPQDRFVLLGDPDRIAMHEWSRADTVQIIPCRARIYSVSEQWQLLTRTPRHVDLFWTPHYNVPVVRPRKLLVTIHDLFHLAMPALVPGVHRRLYARMMFEMVRRRASLILTDSHFTASEFRRLLGSNGPPLRPVHLGINESWFHATPTRRPHTEPFLLYVGNVKPHKNLITLLRAFRSIQPVIPHHLIIIGKREGFITGDPAAVELATSMSARVHFAGEVEISLLEQYMACADALVHPSLYEGFGLPPLEAMASGCPVIVSHAASLPEVCGDAALYCDPYSVQDVAEKILRLLQDRDLQETARQRGRARAAMFTWSRCADQTLEAIDALLAS